MERAKLIVTSVSLLLVIFCLAVCVYFCVELPEDDANISTFQMMSWLFGAATLWFGFNVYSLIKSRK